MLRIDTPVSREYEYLRPNLKINLQKALNQIKQIIAMLIFLSWVKFIWAIILTWQKKNIISQALQTPMAF